MTKILTGLKEITIKRHGQQLEKDFVAIEEPLEIRLNGDPLVVTMRTPGHDQELSAGFLHSEGLVASGTDILSSSATTSNPAANATQLQTTNFEGHSISIVTNDTVSSNSIKKVKREFTATAACGVCGKQEIDDLRQELPRVNSIATSTKLLESLPHLLKEEQRLFKHTGGIHAAGIFSLEGKLLCLREDIGRHNAVDKAIGHFVLKNQVPLINKILVVSGRAGFELVQKALKAEIPIMVSVGAASSIAVEMALRTGMTLYSFAGRDRGNLHVGS
tara:strand:- start:1248 stop:2072 length:825 start_codon:yes stop_codon:yes gene_type:complete